MRRAVGAIAVLSDVHDVLPVLEAVLAEPSRPTPDRAAWAEEYVRSRNSDLDALRAFSPRTRPERPPDPWVA